ncbi:MAG: EthD family reductase [Vulcanimicrobiaceae bacterium]
MAAQLLALYNAPHDPTHFEQYYHGTHLPIAKRLPGLRSYTVSVGAIGSQAAPAPAYLVATLTFDSMTALQAALESPEGREAVADVPKFATGGVTLLMYESRDA